jgi:hypothetical protein
VLVAYNRVLDQQVSCLMHEAEAVPQDTRPHFEWLMVWLDALSVDTMCCHHDTSRLS